MKKSTYLWMLPLLFAWPQQMTAQHPLSLPADSITIDSLLETVEKNTPYRVFSTISAPFQGFGERKSFIPATIKRST